MRSNAIKTTQAPTYERNRFQRVDRDSRLHCHEKGHWAKDCPKKGTTVANSANEIRGKEIGAWMATAGQELGKGLWILDSGAMHHMSSEWELFTNFAQHKATISIANGKAIEATGIGEIVITVQDSKGARTPIRLRGVLYVPALGPNNLVSVRCIHQACGTVVFGGLTRDRVGIHMDGKEMGVAELRRNSYILLASAKERDTQDEERTSPNASANQADHSKTTATLIEWHQHLGHLGFDDIKQLAKSEIPLEISGSMSNPTCEFCQLAKHTRTPNSNQATHRATSPIELIHSDLAGPMVTPSLGGAKYFLQFIDDYSRHTTIYTIRNKSDVIGCFRKYKALVENQQSKKIKRFRSDGGGEYTSNEFSQLLADSGIQREQTAPYTPEQNGVAERANRTIIGRAKAMLFAAGLKDELWGEAVHTAVYLKNRSPTSALPEGMTPLQRFTGEVPNLTSLIPFGAKAFKHVPKELRTKWEPNSIPCIFTGYGGTNQFRVLIGRKIHITRDLSVGKPNNYTNEQRLTPPSNKPFVPITVDEMTGDDIPMSAAETLPPDNPIQEPADPDDLAPPPQTPHRTYTPGVFPQDPIDDIIHLRQPQPAEPPPQEEIYSARPRHTTAGKFSSTRFHDETFSGLAYQKLPPLPTEYHAYYLSNIPEPASYTEAIIGPNQKQWKEAIEEELQSLHDNHTWVITSLPSGRTAVKCKWVFREKKGAEGETIRYKARLVAKGFTQQYGIDYLETYAPVVKLGSLRILLAIAAFNNYEIHQGDIKTAYLLGKLEEEIYMEIPEGVVAPATTQRNGTPVCRLFRGLYGLKQSGRIWNRAWDDFLIGECNFKRSADDYAVYFRIGQQQTPLWTVIWVDDVLWIGDSKDISEAKKELGTRFPLKDLGAAHFFLGMKILRKPAERKIILSQRQYIDMILQRFGFQDCHTVSTPLEPGAQLISNPTPNLTDDESLYRSILGSIMYLMLCTRPDLAFAVGKLSKFNANPSSEHMKALKRLLRYISKTRDHALHFGPYDSHSKPTPFVFSDADWAGDKDNRRSTGAYICTISDTKANSPHTAVSWSSKQQSTVALSSTEAEYMALTQACKEAMWVRRFMREIQSISEQKLPPTIPPITIFADNQGSMALAKNPEFHSRTKHIHIQQHFIREKVVEEEVRLEYLSTGDMAADLLTKALPREKVERFREYIGVLET